LDNFFSDDWCFLLRLIYHPFPKSQILFADCVAFLQGFQKLVFENRRKVSSRVPEDVTVKNGINSTAGAALCRILT